MFCHYIIFTSFCYNFTPPPTPTKPALLFAQALFSLSFFFSLFFGLWYFFQCVKTSQAYMETAALCKYLWCNISMWIDFPLSPSITAATLWKGSPQPCAQAAGRVHGSAASPCAQSICFSLLTETFWTGRVWDCVLSCLSWPPPPPTPNTSKRIGGFCLRDAATGLQNAATEKCDVGQMVKVV